LETVTLNVKQMTCNHCVMTVKKSLEAIEGVESADVTLSPPRAVVTCDLSRVAVDQLTSATREEGYPSTAEAP
jgi:mercuric transport protein